MSGWRRLLVVGVVAGATATLLTACQPNGPTLTVTTPADGSDADPGNGVCEMTPATGDCSLRAAVDEANALGTHDLVAIAPGIDPVLSVAGPGEDGNATGDLDVVGSLTIRGAGATVDSAGLDRILDLHAPGDSHPWINVEAVELTGGYADDGGAIRVDGPATVAVSTSTFDANTATGEGGAIWAAPDSNVSLTNTTLSGNAAGGAGGAIAIHGAATLVFSTVTRNSTGAGGAIHRDLAATGTITSTASIVADQDAGDDCASSITSGGHNIESATTCGLAAAGDQQGTDPLLGPLTSNPGGTPAHLPYVDSPAVDHLLPGVGGCGFIAVDQRAVSRPQHDACDTGAAEVAVTPVDTGGTTNYLGVADASIGGLPADRYDGMVLGVAGPCAPLEHGDMLSPISDATKHGASGNECFGGATEDQTDGTPGDHYDPNGYFFAIDVPPAAAGLPLYVDLYDASECVAQSSQDTGHSSGERVTRFRLRGPDGTPTAPADNPEVASPLTFTTTSAMTGDCASTGTLTSGGWKRRWRRAFVVPAAEPGEYFLQVNSEDLPAANEGHGSNNFSLRVATSPTWDETTTPCSRDVSDPLHDPACPSIAARTWHPGYLAFSTATPVRRATAPPSLPPGGVLELQLWDTGERAQSLELLDPLGRSVSFDWEVVNRTGSDVAPLGGWSGEVHQTGDAPCVGSPSTCQSLDVSGTGPQPGPNRIDDSRYNDRLLQLQVGLPQDPSAEYLGQVQWSIRYATLLASGDRTTWRAFVWETPNAPTG